METPTLLESAAPAATAYRADAGRPPHLPVRPLYLLMARYLKECAGTDCSALPALLGCIADLFAAEFAPAVPKGTASAAAVSRRLADLLARADGAEPPKPIEWRHGLDDLIAWLVRHGVEEARADRHGAASPLH